MPYFLKVNGKSEGPFEAAELLARPDFNGDSLVSAAGAAGPGEWHNAGQVMEFMAAFVARATEAPTVTPPAPAAAAAAARDTAPEAAPAAVPSEADKTEDPAQKLIMIVEDSPSDRGILVTAVKGEGFRVIAAENGRIAAGLLEPRAPDLIVTDLMMPEQGGYEFIRALQAEGRGGIPVLVVTAKKLNAETVASMRAEANIVEVFEKPLNYASFTTKIHNLLGTKSKRSWSPRQKDKADDWQSGF